MIENNLDNTLPFHDLTDDQFKDMILQSKLQLSESKLQKLRKLIFNPFSTNRRGKAFLSIDSDLDPDNNYYNQIVHHVDECDYHVEETFNSLISKTSNTDIFSILHLNIRSIVNKCDDLLAYLNSLKHSFSVLGLTETWLNNDNITNFQIPHCHFIGKARENKQGGGVGLYVNQKYKYRERNDLAININDIIESQFIELTPEAHSTIIGIIYRPPNDNYEQFKEALTELLRKLDLLNKKCFLMGDFNIDLLKIEENPHANDFLNQMFSSSFYPLISRPTRITDTSATLIDNIFVNDIKETFKCGLLFTDISDHLPVFQITRKAQAINTNYKRVKYRQVNKESINNLCLALENEDWISICNDVDPQEAYSCFYRKAFDKYNESIPLVSKSKNNLSNVNTPWITKGILISRKVKNKLYKKFIKNPNKTNETSYKRYRNKFNKIKKAGKKNYYCEKFNNLKGNLKLSWKLIKEIINKNKCRSEINSHFKDNEKSISDSVANKFNEYFVNVGPNLANKIPENTEQFTSYG